MNEEVVSVEQPKIHGFDYRTTIRDPKTGKVIREQHYVRHVSAAYGEFLERDGKFFAPNGDEISDPRKTQEEEIKAQPKVEKKPEVSFTKKA